MTIKAAVKVAFPNREHILSPEGAAALQAIAVSAEGKPRRKGLPIPTRPRVATIRGEVVSVRHERASAPTEEATAVTAFPLEA
jgi:hypothetical protein